MNRSLITLAAAGFVLAAYPDSATAEEERHRGILVKTDTATIGDEEGDSLTVHIGGDDGRDDLDLSAETLERLTDAQVFELLKAKQDRPDEAPVEILVPLAFFATVVGITALVIVFRHRREKLRHETIRLSIESGHPITPELLIPGRVSTLRRGLVLLGAGIGLSIMVGVAADDSGAWAVGMLPAMIGAAYIVIWRLEDRKNGSHEIYGSTRMPPPDDSI